MTTLHRLTEFFDPSHYDLSITFDRSERSFSGTVTIQGIATAEPIRLHSKGLEIESVTYDGKTATWHQESNDELLISYADHGAGRHIITIAYSGRITDAMHGLYPCYYEYKGQKKELLATQFESHHAREVFPCVDEPAAKATFDVTLATEPGVVVLGNMPIKKQRVENNHLVTMFDTTPIMSSYLLAWVIGELHSVSTKTSRGVDVSIWATPAQEKASLAFALDIAARSIDFYEEYFQTEYPLPKSDHVALPDFSSGAMENWGLITYREIALLADPKTTSVSSKRYIATVIAHELAHQWFGNLVTMQWWNDLWLNESFATMMEYLAIDDLHPEWNMWLEFSTNENILALRRDSMDGVQAVQTDVDHPDEINSLFDPSIVYAKGARLLRMLQYYVGNHDFQEGLKQYFKQHAYKNTVAEDLWDAVGKASNKPITDFMNQWISRPGYPVVHVDKTDEKVTLSQEQFFIGPHTSSDRLWPIPIDSSSDLLPELLSTKEITIHESLPTLNLNVADSAHFITHYDESSLSELIIQVKSDELNDLSRLQLIHESTLLARGGVMPSVDLIDIITAYENETSEPVWTMIALALHELRKFVEDDPVSTKKLRRFSSSIAKREFTRLGWVMKDGEPEDDSKLRATILSLMLYGESSTVIRKAKQIYQSGSLESLDPELRPLIISVAVRHSDTHIVDELLSIYQSTSSSDLQQDIAVGATSTRNIKTIKKLLSLIKDATVIRRQDVARWFVYLIRNKESRELSWRWLQDNWDWIDETFSSDKGYDVFPRYAASALSTRQQLEEYKEFFADKKEIPALKRVISLGSSEIEARIELIERDQSAVVKRLQSL